MRLGLTLTLSFLLLAAVVALVGYLYKGTSDSVGAEIVSIRENSIAAFMGAAEMAVALQESQLAAQQIISARLRGLVEPSHETGPLPGLEASIDKAEDSLKVFDRWLARTRDLLQSTTGAAASPAAVSGAESASSSSVSGSLREVEQQFAVYERLMDRFTHLAEWHPTEQLSEFFVDELNPFFEDDLAPTIRTFEEQSRQVLTTELDRMESAHRRANRRNGLVAAASFAIALLLGLVLARSISRPLKTLQEAVSKVAKGELETRVDVGTKNEIGVVAEAFNKMVGELEASTVSRSYLDSIIQSVSEMLVVTDSEGRIRTVNRATLDTLGFSREDLIGRPIGRVVPVEGSRVRGAGEQTFRLAEGGEIPVYCSRSELLADDGSLTGVVLVASDLRERKETEALLRESIAEKEVLLREVHHRVKNNLQIVSSLLNLQDAIGHGADETDRVLRESRNRIRSMALIHEQLYKSEDLARIDFRAYVEELVAYLTRSFDLDRLGIEIVLDVDAVPLAVDRAIPCGMIINELVANSVEHAYPDAGGPIRVGFGLNGALYRLTVSDDGVGLPQGLDPAASPSLGLRLIWALGEQLAADVVFDRSIGTTVSVSFGAIRPEPVEVSV